MGRFSLPIRFRNPPEFAQGTVQWAKKFAQGTVLWAKKSAQGTVLWAKKFARGTIRSGPCVFLIYSEY